MSHNAGGPLAGFAWQLEVTFWMLLNADFGEIVSIEVHDDVAISHSNGTISCIQAKHSEADVEVSQFSADLWKTLGIWLDDLRANTDAERLFCTTRPLADTMRALAKRRAQRSVAESSALMVSLDSAARTSTNASTKAVRTAWRKTPKEVRSGLIEHVRVLEEQPKLSEIQEAHDKAVARLGFQTARVTDVRRDLQGWFHETVNQRLSSRGASIRYEELHKVVCEKHQTMSPIALTSTKGSAPVAPFQPGDAEAVGFLRQLQLIDLGESELQDAHVVHSRAEAQRVTWLNDGVTSDETIADHDADLETFWRRHHLAQARERPHAPVEAGRAVLYRCLDYGSSMRGQAVPGYVTAGSFHMLADTPPRIGWHLNWQGLLNPASS